MNYVFKLDGYKITLGGHDFGGNESDFEQVCEAIEDAVKTLDAEVLAGTAWDIEADEQANPNEDRLHTLVDRVCRGELERLGWHRPERAFVSVSVFQV